MQVILCKQRSRGLTLVELCVVIAVIAIFVLICMSGLSNDRAKARALRIQCVNNLKQTGLAFDVWSSDHGQKFPMEISQTNGGTMEFTVGPNEWRHFQIMSNELRTPNVLICPADDSRLSAASNFSSLRNSNLSYFINLDYSRPNPSAIWSGDRNLTNGTPLHDGILDLTTNRPSAWTAEMHKKVGNLLLFDGSVAQVNETGLLNAVANSGVSTNRLQMPVLGP